MTGRRWGALALALAVFPFAVWQTADRALTASTWGRPWEALGWALFALAFGWGSLRAGRDAGKLWRNGARSKPG